MLKGIDISYHNGEIDFSKLKTQVDFIIMRSGYGTQTTNSKEVKFDIYYEEAKKQNIPVGTYWYCYATTPEEALEEAKTFLNKVKGKKFEYPVFYDVEEKNILSTGKENVSNIMRAFLEEVEKNGYLVGIYCSAYYLTNLVDDDIKNKYEIWVAQWGQNRDKPRYDGKWDIWQYTSDGQMEGIQSQRVDLDFSNKNYEEIIKSSGKNGYNI
jgi:GH25 family lysozyme M1 (1,4-beta-N-acetylmuramidase)